MTVKMIAMALTHTGPVSAWYGSIDTLGSSGGININTAGTLTGSGYTGEADWYRPSGGTPGNSHYVKFTKGVGDPAWQAGLTEGTVYALTSNRSVSWNTPPSAAKQGTLTVSIYTDSGGTNLVGTGTVPFYIDSGV